MYLPLDFGLGQILIYLRHKPTLSGIPTRSEEPTVFFNNYSYTRKYFVNTLVHFQTSEYNVLNNKFEIILLCVDKFVTFVFVSQLKHNTEHREVNNDENVDYLS